MAALLLPYSRSRLHRALDNLKMARGQDAIIELNTEISLFRLIFRLLVALVSEPRCRSICYRSHLKLNFARQSRLLSSERRIYPRRRTTPDTAVSSQDTPLNLPQAGPIACPSTASSTKAAARKAPTSTASRPSPIHSAPLALVSVYGAAAPWVARNA